MSKKVSNEEFLERVKKLFGDTITILSEYQGTGIPVKVRCNIHNTEYMYRPSHLYRGKRGCKQCRYNKVSNTLTHNTQWLKDMIKQYAPNQYELLSEYNTFDTKVKIRHIKCNTVFEVRPSSFYQTIKKGKMYCPHCHNNKALPYDMVKHNIEEWGNHEYELVSTEYKNNNTPLTVKHLTCGTTYKVRYMDFRTGERCPHCFGAVHHDNAWVEDALHNLVGNEYQLQGDYHGYNNKLTLLHKKCGKTFEVRPADFIKVSGSRFGTRCPYCSLKSHGEAYIIKYLDKHNIKYEYQKKFDDLKDKSYLSYDFYLPDYKLLIEYNGIQHYKPVKWKQKYDVDYDKQQKHDKMKVDYAKDNNLQLLIIPYTINSERKINEFLATIFKAK